MKESILKGEPCHLISVVAGQFYCFLCLGKRYVTTQQSAPRTLSRVSSLPAGYRGRGPSGGNIESRSLLTNESGCGRIREEKNESERKRSVTRSMYQPRGVDILRALDVRMVVDSGLRR